MVAEPWLQTHGQRVSDPHLEVVSGPQKLSAPQSVTYFEEHPELKFDSNNNNKRTVVSAFKNPVSWFKSLSIKRKKQELCDDVTDVAGVIEDVEKIDTLMPRILTQMVDRTADLPQAPFNKQTLCRKSPHTIGRSTISSASVAFS